MAGVWTVAPATYLFPRPIAGISLYDGKLNPCIFLPFPRT